jgi:hypothetical protein
MILCTSGMPGLHSECRGGAGCRGVNKDIERKLRDHLLFFRLQRDAYGSFLWMVVGMDEKFRNIALTKINASFKERQEELQSAIAGEAQ